MSATGTPTAHAIGGSNTTLGCPGGVYISSSGAIYVADPCTGRLDKFVPGASGNVAPFAWIGGDTWTLVDPDAVIADSNGNLWVVDDNVPSVDEFGSSLSPGENSIAPSATLTSTALGFPIGIYVDRESHLWIADQSDGVDETPALFEFDPAGGSQSPICTISGPNTTLVNPGASISMAVDNGAYVYAVNGSDYVTPEALRSIRASRVHTDSEDGNPQVSIFAKGQCGNVTPAYTIGGPATDLVDPAAVLVYSTATTTKTLNVIEVLLK
ncbi:MAG: hypothetical protein ACREMP_03095 [Candidatus Tyrphobacter sp.]